MERFAFAAALAVVCACKTAGMQETSKGPGEGGTQQGQAALIEDNARRMIAEGRAIFRDDTFGSEDFFGGALKLHQAIAGEKNGGVGGGVSPKTALSVGLKVDAERVSGPVAAGILFCVAPAERRDSCMRLTASDSASASALRPSRRYASESW